MKEGDAWIQKKAVVSNQKRGQWRGKMAARARGGGGLTVNARDVGERRQESGEERIVGKERNEGRDLEFGIYTMARLVIFLNFDNILIFSFSKSHKSMSPPNSSSSLPWLSAYLKE